MRSSSEYRHCLLLILVAAVSLAGCAGSNAVSKEDEAANESDVIQVQPQEVDELPQFVKELDPAFEQSAPEEAVPTQFGFAGDGEGWCRVKLHNITRFKVQLFVSGDYECTVHRYKSGEIAFPAGEIELNAYGVGTGGSGSDLQWNERILCEPGGRVALQFTDLN